MSRARPWFLALLAVWGAACAGEVERDGVAGPAARHTAEGAIAADDLRADVEVLASDEYEGRATFTPGGDRAAEYLAEHYAEAGLQALPGHDSFLLDYHLDQVPEQAELEGDGGALGHDGKDLISLRLGHGEATGPIVFAGYCIRDPKSGWDDFAKLDVTGKIVLCLRHGPNEPATPPVLSDPNLAAFASKAEAAKAHGAIGLLVVTDPANHEEAADDPFEAPTSLAVPVPPPAHRPRGSTAVVAPSEAPTGLPALRISQALAGKLLGLSRAELIDLQRAVDRGDQPGKHLHRGPKVTVWAHAGAPVPVHAANVAAFLPGSDPRLAGEWIVIGGHYDHLGVGDGKGDVIYNGADDNASGTAGVLELARAFASLPDEARPRRSLVFLAFSGEELGLLGSRALVASGELPLERIRFMLNLDMIGRNPDQPVEILGDAFATDLLAITTRADHDLGVAIDWDHLDYTPASDHDSFFRQAIPSMFFFTGYHADYHGLGDHADKLDYRRMATLCRLAYRIVAEIANADATPRFIHQVEWLGLGYTIDPSQGDDRAVVTEVRDGTIAARAGLAVGDVLAAIDGQPVVASELAAELGAVDAPRDAKPAAKITLTTMRGATRQELPLDRPRPPYLGIQPPTAVPVDQRGKLGLAAGQGVLLPDVVEGGPAWKAGLRKGDIVLTIDGQPSGPHTFLSTLRTLGAGATTELGIARGDQRQTVALTLGERPE